MPRGQELGVNLGTTHRGEQVLALRNAESTFPQTQVLALRSADSKAGRTSARFTKKSAATNQTKQLKGWRAWSSSFLDPPEFFVPRYQLLK